VDPPRSPKPAASSPTSADDETTIIVRHRALADGEDAGEDTSPKPEAADVARFRGVAATRAPARGAEAPAAAKGKLPARARIPKPGKRRVNRR